MDSFSLTGNHIHRLNGEAFRMSLLNGATIQANQITQCHPSAFRALTIADNYWRHHNTPMAFRLSSNSLATVDTIAPLIISDKFSSAVDRLHYLNPLHCEDVPRLLANDFFSAHEGSIFFSMTDKLLDQSDDGADQFHSLSHIASHYCLTKSWFWYYILIGGLCLLILLLVILVLLCVWYRRRRAQQLNLIMPDGRTYRETTIVMQIENHNLLKTDL